MASFNVLNSPIMLRLTIKAWSCEVVIWQACSLWQAVVPFRLTWFKPMGFTSRFLNCLFSLAQVEKNLDDECVDIKSLVFLNEICMHAWYLKVLKWIGMNIPILSDRVS